MMRTRLRTLALLLATAGTPTLMGGCLGTSDDKQGSGLEAGTGGAKPNDGRGIDTDTQAARDDKGDPSTPGTLRQETADKPDTGGLGTGAHAIPGKVEPAKPAEPEPPR
ncbi:hypothetical protein TA3x_005045 [Tundrisphaera sp. TA3]|uniref:hypothetical protein n=1 Tax=Tundrisphaera sp. TA3 TaxID=3435775 RepID=UPI003EB84F9E